MSEKKSFQKDIRIQAWRILIDEGFVSLPIPIEHFLEKYHLHPVTYRHYAKTNGLDPNDLMETYNDDGFIVLINEEYYIIYNEKKPKLRIRWTIMHEIANYLLGHITAGTPIMLRNDIIRESKTIAADNLASRILCPSIVLHTCGVQSPEELSALCRISYPAAEIRYRHLCEIRKHNRFLTFPEETAVLSQFAPFICSYLCKKYTK